MYTDLLNPLPKTINIKGDLFQFDTPKIMGIINLSPDSFYENDAKKKETVLLKKIESFIANGADIIDIGGCSTKPNSSLPSTKVELSRVLEPLTLIRKDFKTLSQLILCAKRWQQSLEIGADIINDISGGYNTKMLDATEIQMSILLTHNINGSINKNVMDDSKTQ